MIVLRVVGLGVIVVMLAGPTRAVLVRAHWTERVPRAAILLWQAVGAAVAMSLIGVCAEVARGAKSSPPKRQAVADFNAHSVIAASTGGLRPAQLFALTAALIVATLTLGAAVTRLLGHARARARQRLLIDLLGRERAQLPGALVVPSTQAAAFSLPGLRPRVVVSSGALEVLADDELAAVLAHERAHVHARHDLVLLPFRAVASVVPSSRSLARVRDEIAALVEMAADDRVLRCSEPTALARALCRLATSASQATPAATTGATPRRVERALIPPRNSRTLACGLALGAAVVLALPILALVLPVVR